VHNSELATSLSAVLVLLRLFPAWRPWHFVSGAHFKHLPSDSQDGREVVCPLPVGLPQQENACKWRF